MLSRLACTLVSCGLSNTLVSCGVSNTLVSFGEPSCLAVSRNCKSIHACCQYTLAVDTRFLSIRVLCVRVCFLPIPLLFRVVSMRSSWRLEPPNPWTWCFNCELRVCVSYTNNSPTMTHDDITWHAYPPHNMTCLSNWITWHAYPLDKMTCLSTW